MSLIEFRTIDLKSAQHLVDVAVTEAEAQGLAVCVTVVDRAGHPLAFARMDGAPLLCAQLSQDKAYTVAAFAGVATHDWWGNVSERPDIVHGLGQQDRFSVIGGGVPLTVDSQLVGAVGVSGGSPEQDRSVAEAAATTVS